MPFKFLAQEKELCQTATFIDVDYRQLMLKKCEVVANTEKLRDVVPDMELLKDPKEVVLKSEKYVALACDLQRIQDLERAMRQVVNPQDEDVSVLYIAEVSITYMDAAAADTLIKWTSSFIPGSFYNSSVKIPTHTYRPILLIGTVFTGWAGSSIRQHNAQALCQAPEST